MQIYEYYLALGNINTHTFRLISAQKNNNEEKPETKSLRFHAFFLAEKQKKSSFADIVL